jgi:hypothetical protein
MKDFSNASFPSETISIMKNALDAAVASLPDPVSSAHVQSIAETILRTANEGERDPATLQEWRSWNFRSRPVIDGGRKQPRHC